MDALFLTPSASTRLAKSTRGASTRRDVAAVARVVLAAGHADGAVVEQQHGDVALVVDHVEQAPHAHVQEGRVADHGDDALVLVGFAAPLVHAERNAHRGAHRDAGVEGVPRMAGAQRVAADVARDVEVAHLRQGVIDAQVRAGHAHGRRPREDLGRQRRRVGLHVAEQAGDAAAQHLGAPVRPARQQVLPCTGMPAPSVRFRPAARFLDDDQGSTMAASSRTSRHRRREAELEHRRGEGPRTHVGRSPEVTKPTRFGRCPPDDGSRRGLLGGRAAGWPSRWNISGMRLPALPAPSPSAPGPS